MKFVRVLLLFLMVTVLNVAASQDTLSGSPPLALAPAAALDPIPSLELPRAAVQEEEASVTQQTVHEAQAILPEGEGKVSQELREVPQEERKIRWADEMSRGSLTQTQEFEVTPEDLEARAYPSSVREAMKEQAKQERDQEYEQKRQAQASLEKEEKFSNLENRLIECLKKEIGFIREVAGELDSYEERLHRILASKKLEYGDSSRLATIKQNLENYLYNLQTSLENTLGSFVNQLYDLNERAEATQNFLRSVQQQWKAVLESVESLQIQEGSSVSVQEQLEQKEPSQDFDSDDMPS